jgi:hypothetical protein
MLPSEPNPADDYDMLTYGEAAARLAELSAAERDGFVALCQHADPRRASTQQLEQRISLLKANDARYRQQSLTAEAFTHRFGLRPRDAQSRAARWTRQ